MKNNFHQQLVDLYAGNDLPEELNEQLELAAFADAKLAHDMSTLKKTVELLQSERGPEFTEESYQRILMKIYARGGNIEPKSAAPAHLQYHLPIQG